MDKEELEKIEKIKGEARGATFKSDMKFLVRKGGEEALKKVEDKLSEWGHPFEYKNIEVMGFYPLKLRILSLLAAKEALGWEDEVIKEMGREAPKESLIIKLFMKFFFSMEETVKQASKIWDKHYTEGTLEAKAWEEERRAVVKLSDIELHPIFCTYFSGYLTTIIRMIVGAEVKCEEITCSVEGGKEGENKYVLRWGES